MAGHTKRQQRQEKLIAALLCQPTIALAARQAQVGEDTAHRWMREPDFKAAYAEARQRVLEEALRYLQSTMLAAVETLRSVMLDDQTRPAQKIMAAKVVLELGLRSYELEELEARITALEQHQKGL